MLRGRAVTIHALAPRPVRAIELASPVLARPDSTEFHRVAYATSIAFATVGRLDDAVELGSRGYAAHDRLRDVARQLPESQHVGPVLALVALGRLDSAAELAAAGRTRSAASFDAESQATFALLDGMVALAAGRVVDAARAFREAAAINTDIGDHVALRWSLGGVCLAAAMAGDRSGAASAASHLDAVAATAVKLLDATLVERGRAWECAMRGDLTGAARVLRAAIDDAVATDQYTAASVLLHDLVCIDGRADDATRLVGVASRVDGGLVATRTAHATAMVGHDADALEAAAGRFAELGAPIEAAIAASHAARELAAVGFDRRARAMESAMATALAACQGAVPPLRVERAAPVELTRREREIAMLAAGGCSNREISEQLYLSVRTVENHLQRAYEKLGVTSRAELTRALGGQAEARGISSTDR
jgi:DNA-binding CsgD family transcriptional regulator